MNTLLQVIFSICMTIFCIFMFDIIMKCLDSKESQKMPEMIKDDLAEDIISSIEMKLSQGKEAESDLEKMIAKLPSLSTNLAAYVRYRNMIIQYIQRFAV